MMRLRGMTLGTFAKALVAGRRAIPDPTHVFVCVADHYEPDWRGASRDTQQERVARWVREYGPAVDRYSDSRGRMPQHTFFYPIECYRPELIDPLTELVRSGYGDIEVHLHHDNDNAESLRAFLLETTAMLHERHGLLSCDSSGLIRYGFIHGNWALANSHPDGRWCGVDDEITILRETGCYADFTMPAAPHAAQTRTINSIYYALNDPLKTRPHDRGIPATVGVAPVKEGLLMIQGPLLVTQSRFWKRPSVENGNLSGSQPPSAARVAQWVKARVAVRGHEKWQFVKLHTHGAQENNAAVLLGQEMGQFHQGLRDLADRRGFEFFYVTAREMAQLVGQAEKGCAVPDFEHLNWD